ncbi:MAG TPA: response regulator [Flavipsychrobacter sp.]
MANAVIAYLEKSINPGGTPQRMKEWMGAMLLFQVAGMILPGNSIAELTVADIILVSATVLTVLALWWYREPELQIKLCWVFFYSGMLVHLLGALYYNTNRADFVMVTSWGIVMFISERRYYINFAQFMYAVLCVTIMITILTFLTLDIPLPHAPNNIPLMAVGMLTVACNIYLLITDFKYGKHRMDYFERYFDKIAELSTSLSKILMVDKPIEQAMWDVTRECIPLLGLEDFIIYLYDKDKNRLVQVAAYGQKSGEQSGILNPLEIKPGEGIVGRVFSEKKPVLVKDTSKEPDYLVDDATRYSELAVPILIGDEVFGVIDSEHSQRNFYRDTHMQLFHVIAAFCSIKAAQHEVRRQILEAEKNRLEVAKMRELEQLKNKFITNISHDLKTPLSLILGPANQMYKTSGDEFIKKQARYIIKNTDHLMAMVEQLLQLNKIEQGIEKVNVETVDLDSMLADMKTQYTPLAEESSIDFIIRGETGLLLTTDSFKLSQCIHNLLQNAFKYATGQIILTAKRLRDNNISISIADDGTGIHPDEHRKIFERFYKIDINNHKGTGIGLSLVKEYLLQLKGSVTVDSAPGKGAVFTLVLPGLVVEQATVIESPDDVTVDDKQPLVVVAEDHIELNEFIAQSLVQSGYRCLRAYNGREALRLVEKHLPDIVITDLMMPEMSGEELVAAVKESDSIGHIPIVVLTAKNQVDNRIDLYQAGADNYIPKPFKMDELLAVVENVLKQRKKLRDKFYTRYMPDDVVTSANVAHADADGATHDNPIVKQCIEHILANIEDDGLSVNTLGAALGMGRNRLQKEIKTAAGMTPVEFIRSIRLHEAYKLLQSGQNYNVSEVAYKTGFSNLSYFSRSFKAQFGYAPSEMMPG